MRRTALLALSFALAGCQFAGSPFDGFGGFLYDTHTFRSNPNLPASSGETIQRVEGQDVVIPPLLPEPGDVWPGPIKPIPSMQDLQQVNPATLPPPNVPAAPPPPLFPGEPTLPQGPKSGTITTPQGPTTTYQGGNGITTYQAPGGGQGIVVPNGNGTSTLIGPNGEIQTIPTPK
jgi:hypothetical protein